MFVREGQKVWPMCPECGCRLNIFTNSMFATLRHFEGNLFDRDARGCKCERLNSEWTVFINNITHLGYC